MKLKLIIAQLLRSHIYNKTSDNCISKISTRTGVSRKAIYNMLNGNDYKISSVEKILDDILKTIKN